MIKVVSSEEPRARYVVTDMISIETRYGEFVLQCKAVNRSNVTQERESLRDLLEELYYREDIDEVLNELGYNVVMINVKNNDDIPTVPIEMRSTGETAASMNRKCLRELESNRVARSASWVEAGNSRVLKKTL